MHIVSLLTTCTLFVPCSIQIALAGSASNAGSRSAHLQTRDPRIQQTASQKVLLGETVSSSHSSVNQTTLAQAMHPRTPTAFTVASVASGPANACDLNADTTVNVIDVQLAVNMYLDPNPLDCTATVAGNGVCNQDVINRITTAALGGTCVTGQGTHGVTLSWGQSSTANVTYNVYRGTVSGGPYYKVNASVIPGTSFSDIDVNAGSTYYYVATAVDTSNNESSYSNQASATVPTP